MKSKEKELETLEADLLKAAKQATMKLRLTSPKRADVAKSSSLAFGEREERLLREKLVTRLKEKEVLKMQHLNQRLHDAKCTKNGFLASTDEDHNEASVEDISDADLNEVNIVKEALSPTYT